MWVLATACKALAVISIGDLSICRPYGELSTPWVGKVETVVQDVMHKTWCSFLAMHDIYGVPACERPKALSAPASTTTSILFSEVHKIVTVEAVETVNQQALTASPAAPSTPLPTNSRDWEWVEGTSALANFDVPPALAALLPNPASLVYAGMEWIAGPLASFSDSSASALAASPRMLRMLTELNSLDEDIGPPVEDGAVLLLYKVGDWAISSPGEIRFQLPTPFELLMGVTAIGAVLFFLTIRLRSPRKIPHWLCHTFWHWLLPLPLHLFWTTFTVLTFLIRQFLGFLILANFRQWWINGYGVFSNPENTFSAKFPIMLSLLIWHQLMNPYVEEREAALRRAVHILGNVIGAWARDHYYILHDAFEQHKPKTTPICEFIIACAVSLFNASIRGMGQTYSFIIETCIPLIPQTFTWCYHGLTVHGLAFVHRSLDWFYFEAWPVIHFVVAKLWPAEWILGYQMSNFPTDNMWDLDIARKAKNLSLRDRMTLLENEHARNFDPFSPEAKTMAILGKKCQSYRTSLGITVNLLNTSRRIIDTIANYQYDRRLCSEWNDGKIIPRFSRYDEPRHAVPFRSAPYIWSLEPSGEQGYHIAITNGSLGVPPGERFQRNGNIHVNGVSVPNYRPSGELTHGSVDLFATDDRIRPFQMLWPGIEVSDALIHEEHNPFKYSEWKPCVPIEKQLCFKEQIEDLAVSFEIDQWDFENGKRRVPK